MVEYWKENQERSPRLHWFWYSPLYDWSRKHASTSAPPPSPAKKKKDGKAKLITNKDLVTYVSRTSGGLLVFTMTPCVIFPYRILEIWKKDYRHACTCKWQWDTTDSFPTLTPPSMIEFTTTEERSTFGVTPWLFCNQEKKSKESRRGKQIGPCTIFSW